MPFHGLEFTVTFCRDLFGCRPFQRRLDFCQQTQQTQHAGEDQHDLHQHIQPALVPEHIVQAAFRPGRGKRINRSRQDEPAQQENEQNGDADEQRPRQDRLRIDDIITGNADGEDEQDGHQPGSHAQLDYRNLACSV